MVLNTAEMGYFITQVRPPRLLRPSEKLTDPSQVALSAASFGVTEEDIAAAGTALNGAFNNRCGAAIAVVPDQTPAFQSTCTDEDCMLAEGGSCDAQAVIAAPVAAAAATSGASGSASMSGGATMTSGSATGTAAGTAGSAAPTTTAATGGAIQASASVGALLFGLFAALF